jgi:hypothetical protein
VTVAHNDRHPLAGKWVIPSNGAIYSKFGVVLVEDWSDRLAQATWPELLERGDQHAVDYKNLAVSQGASTTDANKLQVVRCHTQTTGELALLHDDWLKNAQVVA